MLISVFTYQRPALMEPARLSMIHAPRTRGAHQTVSSSRPGAWSPFNLAQLNLSTSGPGKCVDGKCTNLGQELKQDDPCESTGPSCGTGTSSLILSGPMET